jgi:hypothetical protein
MHPYAASCDVSRVRPDGNALRRSTPGANAPKLPAGGNSARFKITRAALMSAFSAYLQPTQTNSDCERRERASISPHELHSRDVFLGSTSTIVRTALSAFSTSMCLKIDQPAFRISRFKPAFALTFRPGSSSVPAADRVIDPTLSFSIAIVS